MTSSGALLQPSKGRQKVCPVSFAQHRRSFSSKISEASNILFGLGVRTLHDTRHKFCELLPTHRLNIWPSDNQSDNQSPSKSYQVIRSRRLWLCNPFCPISFLFFLQRQVWRLHVHLRSQKCLLLGHDNENAANMANMQKKGQTCEINVPHLAGVTSPRIGILNHTLTWSSSCKALIILSRIARQRISATSST